MKKGVFKTSKIAHCSNCNSLFLSRLGGEKLMAKYCSRPCYWVSKNGVKQTEEHKLKISKALSGKPKSIEHIRKVTEATKGQIRLHLRDENHPNWKGENAQKCTKHDWIYKRLGSPKKCDHCGTTEKRIYHWANKSQNYKRDIKDWMRLCVPCHSRYDHNHPDSGYNKYKGQGMT